ncbi:PREDICTED: afadin- and alpha-actinin-binding protein B-like [Acropora digitifera]|uniref:afadin- and alpha-actinin-binding protein B-like n=1 Tax=Acropora digitifera TaxID=70779 RepID=UPI00077B0EBB|nr:PREDICTED: afadin- and alpha-actinin-binding protein B-like [Acropora digitifera]
MNENVQDWGEFVNRYTSCSSRNSSPDRDTVFGDVKRTPSPGLPLFSLSDKHFCRRDNIDQCLAYLNQEFGVLGFSSLFTPSRNGSGPPDTFDIVKLINSTYELLQQQQRSAKQRTDLEENFTTNQQEQLEAAQREIAMGNERERQLQSKLLKTKEDLKLEREELKKTKANVVHLQKQYDHEGRKKEREFNKLKDRIHQLLTDKSQEKKVGLDILNLVKRPSGQRATWKTGTAKNEEEMYRVLITGYEERQKELMVENNDLRESLQSMQTELINLLNHHDEDQSEHTDNETEVPFFLQERELSESGSIEELSTGHFHMPYDLVREGIEKNLREKWRLLKCRLEEASKVSNNEATRSLQKKKITRKNEHKKGRVSSLQGKIKSPTKDSLFLTDPELLEEKEKFSSDREFFNEQRAAMENQRKQLTDAAIKLGHERKKFEEERASFYKAQLLTPVRKQSNGGRSSKSPEGLRLQFSSASFSPAPRNLFPSSETRVSLKIPRDGPIENPSTDDLYKALSLTPDKSQEINEFNETPLKAYSSEDGSRQRSLSLTKNASSVDAMKENYCDAKQARRINEHAQNVKKALQMQQSSSSDL